MRTKKSTFLKNIHVQACSHCESESDNYTAECVHAHCSCRVQHSTRLHRHTPVGTHTSITSKLTHTQAKSYKILTSKNMNTQLSHSHTPSYPVRFSVETKCSGEEQTQYCAGVNLLRNVFFHMSVQVHQFRSNWFRK